MNDSSNFYRDPNSKAEPLVTGGDSRIPLGSIGETPPVVEVTRTVPLQAERTRYTIPRGISIGLIVSGVTLGLVTLLLERRAAAAPVVEPVVSAPVFAPEPVLTTQVVTEQQSIDVPVVHEVLVVERRPADETLVPSSTPLGEGEVNITLSAEQLDVHKDVVVTDEIAVGIVPLVTIEEPLGGSFGDSALETGGVHLGTETRHDV